MIAIHANICFMVFVLYYLILSRCLFGEEKYGCRDRKRRACLSEEEEDCCRDTCKRRMKKKKKEEKDDEKGFWISTR